jgi:uncharacterized protein DUF4192
MDTNEKTVISAAGPEDMIATVWFSLGYKPRDSLVVIGLEGPRQRVGVLLRADLPVSRTSDRSGEPIRPLDRLPPDALRAILPDIVRDLLVTVAASGAGGVLAIVADEQAFDRRPPAVVRVLRHEARSFGLHLFDVLGVTRTAFASLLCRDPRCCPPGGRPIEEVLSSRSAAVHVVHGDTVAESEADLLVDVTPGPSDPVDPPSRLLSGPRSDAQQSQWSAVQERCRWWESWTRACSGAARVPGSVEPLRGFAAALYDSHLRDAVLMGLLGASDEELRAMLDGTYGLESEHPDWLGPGLFGAGVFGAGSVDPDSYGADSYGAGSPGAGPHGAGSLGSGRVGRDLGRLLRRPPESARLRLGRTVLAAAVRVAGEGDRAPALSVLAMLAWFEGKGGRSRLLIERALADSESVSLTRLVEGLLTRRVAPPWLRNGPEG